jgi:hypothetical protein
MLAAVMARALLGLLAALLVAMSLAPTALAQSEEDLQRARALFAEGVELANAEQWDEAVDRFRQVLEVRSTPQVKYNLALALEGAGELSEAATLLREIQDSRELDRRTRRDVQRLLEAIGPRLGQLTVRITGDEAGVRVLVDGDEVPLDRVGQPLAVDPGEHRVVMERRGRAVASQSVTVTSGETAEVTLVETAVPAAALDDELLTQEVPPAAGGGNVLEEWWFWTIIGAVVLATAVTIGVVAATSGPPSPVQGNLMPGVLEVMLP